MAWFVIHYLPKHYSKAVIQLHNIMNETAGASDPKIQSEHEFVMLLLGVEDNMQALGTIQDAVTHGLL
jgi:hypothetical protein